MDIGVAMADSGVVRTIGLGSGLAISKDVHYAKNNLQMQSQQFTRSLRL